MATVNQADWSRLSRVRAWTPLREITESVQPIHDDLYRVVDELYVLATPITRDLQEGDQRAPFVTMLFWAPSDGAARRAALNAIDVDDGAFGTPPSVLWTNSEPPTYSLLLRSAGALGEGGQAERATYAEDGRFVHKVIDTGSCRFYFRERVVHGAERPYAVGMILPD
jgi:hypothetical protein